MDPPLLAQLREQTRPAHLALEAQPLLQRLLSSELTVAQYAQLLQSLLAFYRSLERELVPASAAFLERYPTPDYRYLPRAPLLANDCQALGCASPGFHHPLADVRLDHSGASLLGVLYVIEGSTQGGRLIARHLAHTLGISEDSGARFFTLYRRENTWAAFRHWLGSDLAVSYQDHTKGIIEAADMTFTALHTHLDQWQHGTHGH